MARDRVALDPPQPAAIGCADVRPWFSAHRSGQISLTEWALVEGHLRQCARCRQEEARQQQVDGQRPATWARAALSTLVARCWSPLMAVATGVTPRVIAGLMQALSLGIGHGAGLIARLRGVRAIALEFLARAMARWSSGPRPPAPPPAPARPELLPTRLEPAPPGTRPPATSVDSRGFAWVRAAEVTRTGPPPPAPVPAPAVAAPCVVGRLSTKDRRAAERALTALLTDVQGTELDRTHHPRFTAVQVIVPHSRYREFTSGLGRIGFWRLEATAFSLPDAIHMTVRVSE